MRLRARGCIEDGIEIENNSLLVAMSYNDSDDAYFVSYLLCTPEMNAKFVRILIHRWLSIWMMKQILL